MTSKKIGKFEIENHQIINILFGKNGSGKSTTLKEIATILQEENKGLIEYITPERGGILTYQSGVEQNMQNQTWYENTRKNNQFGQFKEQSVIIFKELKAMNSMQLESYIAENSESNHISTQDLQDLLFKRQIIKINSLLDNIEIREDKLSFKIYPKGSNEPVLSEKISSGESELIALAIECLAYEAKCDNEKENFLLLDSPDVHIHPDLQVRLMHFIKDLVSKKNFTVLIATHSTALIGALENYEHIGFNFFVKGKTEISFQIPSTEYKNLLPIFGAHPLSNIYSQTPIFLVEGDDEFWLWQQAIKTSSKLKLYPCVVDGKGNMLSYENKINEIILSVYDSPEAKGYSLCDRDDKINDEIGTPHLSKVKRFMLSCRCSENLLLTDDVLIKVGTTWEELKENLIEWIKNSPSHKKIKKMIEFKEGGFNRKSHQIKEITNIIVSLITAKPWQFIVGQTIGEKIKENELGKNFNNENSLDSYLGEKLVNLLLKNSG